MGSDEMTNFQALMTKEIPSPNGRPAFELEERTARFGEAAIHFGGNHEAMHCTIDMKASTFFRH
jgi:hypothetical protein